jgi:hypothetical protein
VRAGALMDTNVAVVANGRAPQAGDRCMATCIETLRDLRENWRLLLDDQGLVLDEYRRNLSPSGQPGPGDAFFKWLWSNQGNPEHCRQVAITPIRNDRRSFEEFPDDPDLAGFDPSDRKFVAVSIASGERAPVLNAVDSDWWNYREALARHGIEVRFLCPELMKGAR